MAASGVVPCLLERNPSTKSLESSHATSSPQVAMTMSLEGGASPTVAKINEVLSHSRMSSSGPLSLDKNRSVPPSKEPPLQAVPAGSPWVGVSSPMDQVETAEWQQVERFLDMLVSSKSTGNSRNIEQLASAFARHLTVIRQREELRIHSIRQLQTDRREEQDHEEEFNRLRNELSNHMETSEVRIVNLQSELKFSEQEAEQAVLEKRALNHAMDIEFQKVQREREELVSMLQHTENSQAAIHRLSSSERERDSARLELLEAELSLTRNKVKDLEEEVATCKKDFEMSEKGRKEALAAANSVRQECKISEQGRKEALTAANAAREEFKKVQTDVLHAQEKVKKLEKERKVYESAARKAAGELVNLRLRSPSPSPVPVKDRDNLMISVESVPNLNTTYTMQNVVEIAEKLEATMGNNLDVSVGGRSGGSGSDKATTASDSKGSDKVTDSSDSPNLDKPVLPRIRSVSTPTSDSESKETPTSDSNGTSPDNTLAALPPMQEFKGETVMRAALELAAAARMKAEKALSMREEERRENRVIDCGAPSPEFFSRDQYQSFDAEFSRGRTFDGLADSMRQVYAHRDASPTPSPRHRHPHSQAPVMHPSPLLPVELPLPTQSSLALPPQTAMQPPIGLSPQAALQPPQMPPGLATFDCRRPRQPSPQPARQRHPSPTPVHPAPMSTLPGAPGTRSMTNLAQPRTPNVPVTPNMKESRQANRPQFPQRGPQPLPRRR